MVSYSQKIRKLSIGKINVPDEIKVITSSKTLSGRLMPSFEDNPLSLVLKLDNGYNVGISFSKIKEICLVKKSKKTKTITRTMKSKNQLPTILLIATGGTIASRVDYETGGVIALSKPEDFLSMNPEISKISNLKILQPFNVMSENMMFSHYSELAKIIGKEIKKYDGIIITHGTDTLHYTSAALSFMFNNLEKPIAIVGAQRSSDRGSADGVQNLLCAVHYCLSDIAEVSVVMHGSSDDDYCLAIRGTKVRKMHTERRDAFRPVNDEPLAKIWPSGQLEILNKHYRKRGGCTEVNACLFNGVALIKAYPNSDPRIIDFHVKNGVKGIVFEGTGFGHVHEDWIPIIEKYCKKLFFVQTSQCLYGRTNELVYSGLRKLNDLGVINGGDMLPETAYIKLAWVLGQTSKRKDVERLMKTNLVGEINKKSLYKTFLY
ncbi:MAG: Glu-tRNA(Gln) amidotransferase subunit GatD [Nanoarchaeota archaeon]|nr:Glu-tRNA(Gln) amidotransferase subunit GatD [Nanoarchaeota archaeon]